MRLRAERVVANSTAPITSGATIEITGNRTFAGSLGASGKATVRSVGRSSTRGDRTKLTSVEVDWNSEIGRRWVTRKRVAPTVTSSSGPTTTRATLTPPTSTP